MKENGMPLKQTCVNCVHCGAATCSDSKQSDFDGLQVDCTDGHDQMLVDARMLDVASSTESRKTTTKSSDIGTKRHSDYWLKRVMASLDKLGTFLTRRPRANTHMEAHVHTAAPQRSNTN